MLSVITFLDRMAIPTEQSSIRSDLHLSPDRFGWVLSAYVLSNALFEIPSGMMGDRKGRRSELTRITVWWSSFTALTGACKTFWQMLGARFLFGAGAAGVYPNAAGVISRWFPKQEHARAQGFVWAASRLGGVLAPLLLVPLGIRLGWRTVFWLLGGLGIAWSACWWAWFRDRPEEMKNIRADELEEIRAGQIAGDAQSSIPWRQLLALPQLWLIVVAYFCYAWGSWFFFGWFTTWLTQGAGFSVAQMGFFAAFPFAMGMAGNLVGGVASEWLVERYGRRKTYRWVTAICLTASSGLLLGMSLMRDHASIIVMATLGFGVMDLMLPSAWAMCMSVGGRFGGTATGIMNTAGNLGGWFCTVLFGYVVRATGNYNVPLRAVAAMVLIGAIVFARVDCTKGLVEPGSAS